MARLIRLFDSAEDDGSREAFIYHAAQLLAAEARPRLYLIDEPEQNLHPALQRQAVQSLRQLAAAGPNVVAATHSPHFLREDAIYVHLDRFGLTPFKPEELHAASVIAEELGFDRGELLCGVGLVLYVEGETDVAILDGLFRRQLHELGVLLVSTGGALNAGQKGLVDSERSSCV
jgi:predicted ATP-dependent endonuclease of OLD family